MAMFHKVVDIQSAEMLNLPVPKILSGKPITVAIDPSPELREYTDKLVKRSEKIAKRMVNSQEDNMLCVTNDGRNAALDMRCIRPVPKPGDGGQQFRYAESALKHKLEPCSCFRTRRRPSCRCVFARGFFVRLSRFASRTRR